ncbi:hypothetical protein O9H85_03195 [Paenibacillus filicis]|uniref:Uncharacterized protein n=1 Tax=Paenibacillus gyeongsangnamensis TaxID=3388067 RepID=A0ABT4Q3N8_9BACL|nr:PQQ-binding-like beta-propeller repeat protein [Paenibacillus filicis]MCZ8511457.1 hypothetical protein [Paenibacillus filicis]
MNLIKGSIAGLLIIGVLSACGTQQKQNSSSNPPVQITKTENKDNYSLIGAAASPPMGDGNGNLLIYQLSKQEKTSIPLETGSNAFRIGIYDNKAYVPTLQGKTYVIDLKTNKTIQTIQTEQGARIADISEQEKILLITGPKNVVAYSLPDLQVKWKLDQGGNTLAITDNVAYLSGNNRKDTLVINLADGSIKNKIEAGRVEDSIYDKQLHSLWLADWFTGNMTVVDTTNNKVVTVIKTSEGDPNISPQTMNSVKSAFMQLAVDPNGKHVYAAGFSGNIQVFDANDNKFLESIPIASDGRLSGLTISPTGDYAYTTIENKKETAIVSLSTKKITQTISDLAANRWFMTKK